MVRLSNALCLLGLIAASSQYDPEAQNRDATCDNNCFFKFFTNKCNSDNPACSCTLNDMREKYFCCLAKNCLPHVLPDAVERAADNCDAWNIPFGRDFDAEAVCGIKVASPSTSEPSMAEPTGSAKSTTDSKTPATTATDSSSVASSAVSESSKSGDKSAAATPSSDATTSGAAAATTSAKARGSRTCIQDIATIIGLAALVAVAL